MDLVLRRAGTNTHTHVHTRTHKAKEGFSGVESTVCYLGMTLSLEDCLAVAEENPLLEYVCVFVCVSYLLNFTAGKEEKYEFLLT